MQRKIVQSRVVEEIRHIVANAIRDGRIVKTGRHAPDVLRAYPNCGLTVDEVINEIGAAAACAGVAVEFSRPEHVC